MGDAPHNDDSYSPDFTSYVHGSGAGRTLNELTLSSPRAGPAHLFGTKRRWHTQNRNFTYEWIGTEEWSDVDSECEAWVVGGTADLDTLDDGVRLEPSIPLANKPLQITVDVKTAPDNYTERHDYSAQPLFVNLWVDLDGNGKWEPGERKISNEQLTGPGFKSTTIQYPNTCENVWLRARLDWGEGVGQVDGVHPDLSRHEGPARFGEVEDHRLRALKNAPVKTRAYDVEGPNEPNEPNEPNGPNVPGPSTDPRTDPNWIWEPNGLVTLEPGETIFIGLGNFHIPENIKILEITFTGEGAEDIRVGAAWGYCEGGSKSQTAKTAEIHLPGQTIYQFSFDPQPDWEVLRVTNTGLDTCTFTVTWMSTCVQVRDFDFSQENRMVIDRMNMFYENIDATIEVNSVAIFHDGKSAGTAEFNPFEDDGTWTGEFTVENPNTGEPMPQGGWLWQCEDHDEGIWEGERFGLSLTTMELAGGKYRLFVHDRLRQTWFEFALEVDGCIVLDDFESYETAVDFWEVWDEGFVNNTTSQAYPQIDPAYVFGGLQSMLFIYTNATEPHYAEADRRYEIGQDWTASGAEALSMWFRGYELNDANEPMYVKAEDAADVSATVPYDGDANDLRNGEWRIWRVALQDFHDINGVNLADVVKLTIGIGDRNEPTGPGVGMMHFDDIRLCPAGCIGAYSDLSADISGPDGQPDCAVDNWDLKAAAQEWLTLGVHADLVHDNIVNFKDYAMIAQQWLEKQLWP